MKRKNLFLIALLFTGLFMHPGLNTAVSAADAPKEFTLGGLFPLTGGLSGGGVEREAAFRLAIEEINADDTFLPDTTIKYLIRDTGTDATQGSTAATELIDSGVIGLVGAASSTVSKAIAKIAETSKIPQISYSSTNPGLSDKTEYPYFLRVVPSDAEQGVALATILDNLGITSVSTLATSDDYGLGGIDVFEAAAIAAGITVDVTQRFEPGATDVSSQLTALKAGTATTIVLNVVVGDAKTVFAQALAAGVSSADGIQWVGTDGPTQDQVFEGAAAVETAMTGMIGTAPNRGAGTGDTYNHFLDLWECANNETYSGSGDRAPNTYATFAYDAVYAFAHAVDAIGTDAEDGAKLLAQLKLTSFTGATGQVSFNDKGDRTGVYDVLNLQGGAFATVGSFDSTGLKQWADMKDDAGAVAFAKDGTSTAPSSDYTPEACENFDFIQTAGAPGFSAWIALLSIFAIVPIVRRRK
ncbi:MAG: ABC transporter substrate-binding protein [Candidatus Heimdallarchaeota archaeon]|nr:ABC transporter substrate-binding protein [Candidatus Heimdallarchaeota archaeon]